MKAYDIINGPVWQSIRKLLPGATKVNIPGIPGTWFNDADNLISAVVSMNESTGEFIVKGSISNVNVANHTVIVPDPTDIPEAVLEILKQFQGIGREGRTVGRAEEIEQKYGTLTGLNLKDLTIDESPETASFDDAVLELPREISLT